MSEGKKRLCALGIDTSNYTTSVALVDEKGRVLADCRKLLDVKPGERGLRQSDAVFQHVNQLSDLVEDALAKAGPEIEIILVSASERPRPVEGSYMPCFLPGVTLGKSLAAALSVPYVGTSHQEGHLQALLPEHKELSIEKGFLCFHLSGGTCELLHITNDGMPIVGGSRDISFGQVLDRIGVSRGDGFPAGKALDEIAFQELERHFNHPSKLPKIRCNDGWIDLAGFETAVRRALESDPGKDAEILLQMFQQMAMAIWEICEEGKGKTGCGDVLLVGGVSTSRTIKHLLQEYEIAGENQPDRNIHFHMDDSDRGRDNAVGVARSGLLALAD